mgnify:CR=1 FL=1
MNDPFIDPSIDPVIDLVIDHFQWREVVSIHRESDLGGIVEHDSPRRNELPEVFDRMARLERKLNTAINKSYAGGGKRKGVFLDELDPNAGRGYVEPMDCGLFCQEDNAND